MKRPSSRNPQKVREEKEFPKTPGYKTPAGAYEPETSQRKLTKRESKEGGDPTKVE